MADSKISGLTDGSPAQGTDEVPVHRGVTTRRVLLSGIAAVGTPAAHAHPESDITGLSGDLALKEDKANKNALNGYAGLDGSAKLNGAQQVYGSVANTACQGNDSRLNDARTPTAHATTHKSGGSDSIKLDELAAPTDITTLNVTSSQHGLSPKSPADATQFLNGAATPGYAQVKDSDLSTSDVATNNVSSTKHGFTPKSPADATKFLNGASTPVFAAVKDSDLSLSDISTNNVSISQHGFTPKLSNVATQFLNGVGAWATPSGSGGGETTPSGTGFEHVTGGVLDGTAKLVDTGDINNNQVTNAKLAQMPAHTYKGNNTGATADPADVSATNLTADLDVFVASGASHKKGLVIDPGSVAGTTKFLREDATWAVPPSGGGGPGTEVWGVVNSDVPVTASITLVDATGIKITLGTSPTEIWQFEMQLLVNTIGIIASADYKLAWTFPSLATAQWGPHALTQAAGQGFFDPVSLSGSQQALFNQTSIPVFGATNNLTFGVFLRGWWFGGGNAGDVQLRFAESIAAASTSVIIKRGSAIFARKIAS